MNQFSSFSSSGVSDAVMPEVKNVSGTAFVVAEFRAEENNEAYPLYRDSIVELFLNAETRQAAGRVAASFPHVSDIVKIRTGWTLEPYENQWLALLISKLMMARR